MTAQEPSGDSPHGMFNVDREEMKNMVLFGTLGLGANWVLPTALLQQIPWFSEHLPEELCVATYMNVAAACAASCSFLYYYLTEHGYNVPRVSVPALLAMSFIGSVYVALTYSYSIYGNSYFLFSGHYMGCIVGAFSAIIFNPFMAQFDARYISCARGGGSTAILLSAILGLIQSPGQNPRFSPTFFILIFSVMFVFPIFAYRIIVREEIGVRQSTASSSPSFVDDKVLLSASHISSDLATLESESTVSAPASGTIDSSEGGYMWSKPWFKYTLPYALSIGWVNYNTWGMLSAIAPFSFDFAAVDVSEYLLLALAYEIGAFALVLGDFSTIYIRLSFKVILPIFTVCSFMVYLAALHTEGFSTPASGPALVVCFSVGRFIEAHVLTSSFRAIADNLPQGQRDEASRMLGLFDQISSTLGIITSTTLITLLIDCHSSDDD
jgi:uncharacterized protein YqgC (DUF456 family)